MKPNACRIFFACCMVAAACLIPLRKVIASSPGEIVSSPHEELPTRESTDIKLRRVESNFVKLPLSFEANQGQAGPDVKYLTRGNGYAVALTATEAVLSL